MPTRPTRPQAPQTRRTHQRLDLVDGLTQLAFLVQGRLERRAGEHDLSITQTRLLGILRDRRPTMNELAQLLALDKSSISGLVDRAERRGLVARVPSTTDRRAVQVRLTPTGRALVRRVSSQYDADLAALLDGLPARDRTTLAVLVTRVLAHEAERLGVDLFPAG